MFADEPTTALDVVVQRGVVQLLKEIQESLHNTIILVTHDMGIHANVTDRLAIMYAGKIIEEGNTEEIFDNPLHPYTKFLINSLPRFGDRGRQGQCSWESAFSGKSPGWNMSFHPRCPHKMDICEKKIPELNDQGNGHKAACWLLNGGEGKDEGTS